MEGHCEERKPYIIKGKEILDKWISPYLRKPLNRGYSYTKENPAKMAINAGRKPCQQK
jgi:hypothetical protein